MNPPSLELLQEAMARLAAGADDADLFLERRVRHSVQRQGGRQEGCRGGEEWGLGLRRVVGRETDYSYTNDLSPDSILRLASQLAGGGEAVLEGAARPPLRFAVQTRIDPLGLPLPEKAALARRVEEWARALGDRLSEVRVDYADLSRQILMVRGDGQAIEDRRTQVALVLRCVAREGSTLQTATGIRGGAQGLEAFEEEDLREWTVRTAEQAIRMLTAVPAPAGPMPVVLGSRAGGTMVHEAIGHGLEADLVQKGLSVYHGKVGKQVAAPWITVVDDATLVGRRGFLHVDDEGTPAQRTVLVENGVLRGFLHDRSTARREGAVSTGNARRESYRYRPIVRMTNTLIAPGEEDPGAILESTSHGLFVTRMGGGQVDTTTGNFVFKVDEAYLIEGGRLGRPVRGATLIGNGPRVLEQIDRVGSDLGFDMGTCGKDGQGVPVADAQPTLRIPSITVGGERA